MIGGTPIEPTAILFRQIASPNYELRRFLRICARSGFTPLILEYTSDKMSSRNTFKRSLIAPMFLEGINRKGEPYFQRQSLINVEKVENQRLDEISVANQSLPSLHKALLRLALGKSLPKVVDGSHIFTQYAGGAHEYYVDFFCALHSGVVLFEDFVTDEEEANFYKNVVRPAFDKACQIIGQRPHVVRLCENRRTASPLWYGYPASYRALFSQMGCNL